MIIARTDFSKLEDLGPVIFSYGIEDVKGLNVANANFVLVIESHRAFNKQVLILKNDSPLFNLIVLELFFKRIVVKDVGVSVVIQRLKYKVFESLRQLLLLLFGGDHLHEGLESVRHCGKFEHEVVRIPYIDLD